MPTGLIVADFFPHAFVPSAKLCLEDIVRLRCSACGGRAIKMYALPSWLLHSLDFMGVTLGLWLGFLPCIVCCMLCFACAHGVPGCVSVMTPLRYLNFSIRFYFSSIVFEVGKILHPTQSHAETTPSSPCALPPTSPHPDGNSSLPTIASPNASPTSPLLAMEELDVPPPPFSNTTQPSQTGMVNTRHVCGDDLLAVVCHALTDGQGSPTALLQYVESLLRDYWEQPLDMTIPSSGSQLYKLEAQTVSTSVGRCRQARKRLKSVQLSRSVDEDEKVSKSVYNC